VAPLAFANPRSLTFTASEDHGIVLTPIPPPLKALPNPELTFAAWFQATEVGFAGADLIALGGDYALRIKFGEIEWIKRKSTGPGGINAVAQKATFAHHDGKWHHLAGTSGATGMKLYLDGVEIGSTGNTDPAIYNGPDQLGVGHQPGNDQREFTGQIDEVRIYDRALTAPEVANLARGNR
jgi:hypothetical protein